MRRIAVILGHPDPAPERFCRALSDAYVRGALAAGHAVDLIDVAKLEFPLLRTKRDYDGGALPEALRASQAAISKADHIVMIFPLWLGDMPALLKGFLEQIFRPGTAYILAHGEQSAAHLLVGKSARIVITMGMPAAFYRLFYRAHAVKTLKRNILQFCGIAPVKNSLIGTVEGENPAPRRRWLAKLEHYGAKGE